MKYTLMTVLSHVLLVLALGANAAWAAHGPDSNAATGVTGCGNVTDPTKCCDCYGNEEDAPSDGECPKGATSCDTSVIDHLQLNYVHTAIDYAVGRKGDAEGCLPCGGSAGVDGPTNPIQNMVIRRIHRFRRAETNTSFGSFISGDWDLRLHVVKRSAAGSWTIYLNVPDSAGAGVQFSAQGAGIWRDARRNWGTLSLYDADDVLVADPSTAYRGVLRRLDGQLQHFEMYNPGGNPGAWNRYGRLVRSEDRNGNATQYERVIPQADCDLDDRRNQLARIVDPFGRVATFTYGAAKVAGQWAVSRIDLPNGSTLTYSYENGHLSEVQHPDGTVSRFSYTNASPNYQVWSCEDPATEHGWRIKMVWLSTGIWHDAASGTTVNQPPNMVRAVTLPGGELVYQNWQDPNDPHTKYHYLGGNELLRYRTGAPQRFLPRDSAYATDFVLGMKPWDATFALWQQPTGLSAYSMSKWKDALGRTFAYTRHPSTQRVTGRSYPDGTSSQHTYNSFTQVTEYVDRLGRVTQMTYDSNGNRLTRTEAAGTPAEATWRWAYNARGQVISAFEPLYDVAHPDLHRTDYEYDAIGQLVAIIASADESGGVRPRREYDYDAAGRLGAQRDAEGRQVVYAYDLGNRLTQATYADSSSEQWSYGLTGGAAGLLVDSRDRNGNHTIFGYDAAARRNRTEWAAGTSVAVQEDCTFLPGTRLETVCIKAGERREYAYDDRNRRIKTTVYPRDAVALTTTSTFDVAGRLVATTDAYDRRTLFVYDINDRVVRTIRELIPEGFMGDPASATRVATANPPFVIEETVFDAEGQVLARIDGRSIRHTYGYDAQGRLVEQIEADAQETAPGVFMYLSTPEAARTLITYDAQGNRLAQTLPRSFTRVGDSPWINGSEGVFQTTWTYTGRNLMATQTVADGLDAGGVVRPERATTSQTYSPTGKVATTADARGFVTTFTYGACCDRLKEVIDPAEVKTTFGYDHYGNRTSLTDGNDNTTAWSYDARHRVSSQANGAGETTTYTYDDDLTDGVGLDAVYAAQIADLGLGGMADGNAVKVTNPAGEISVQIQDGLGRTVRSIDGNGNVVTMQYDTVVAGLVETIQIDGVGSITRSRADGRGLVRQALDAEDQMSFQFFDANGNRVRLRDPSGVGMNCTYDARNREIHCKDTRGDVTVVRLTQFDSHGNVVQTTDALGASESFRYDARDRRVAHTDRIAATTIFAYDLSDNLIQITDAEGSVTDYHYDGRNLLVHEAFPKGSLLNRTVRTYGYDAGRRLISRVVTTDPASSFTEVTQYGYDKANRLLTRGYPADGLNDTFQYDPASRLIVASSGRYQNQVEREYDSGGRLTGEWLIGQGNSALPGAWSVWYGYDGANRVRTLTYPNGSVVTRDYTKRHQLKSVTHGGSPVATRTYDAAGKLTKTLLGNDLVETRSYVLDSHLVEMIAVPGVTEFAYEYDANGRKVTEANASAQPNPQTQTFGYDNQDRLTSWSKDAGVVPAQTQEWNLSPVGDWDSVTRDGVVETRKHSDVHEVTRIKVGTGPNRRLHYDAKGNLIKDDENRRYTWDAENRLQTARTPKAVSPTGQNLRSAYAYDALGRRVAKTVNGRVTRFIHAGAQVIQEEDGQAVAPPAERNGDGDLADLADEPASGGILPASSDPSAPVLRINFQPRTTVIPPGFLADKGKKFAARTNGLSYGWSANLHNRDRIQRFAADLEEWDTFLRAARPGRPARSWQIALPNGTYPVIVVAGDAVSRNHTNNLVIAGIPVTDPDPATMDTGYELGDFDGYAVQVTVTDGLLTIAPGVGSFDPTVCFIEIGLEGTTITPDVEARLDELVESMTTATYAPQAPSLARRQYVYGHYVDELLSYTVGETRYFTHANHLYSIAATTNAAGSVVERYAYDAYGQQTVTNAAGTVTLAESGVSQTRGFTGFYEDKETGLLRSQTRPYHTTLGRWIGRDPLGYINGMSLYAAYFVPNLLDPTGTDVALGSAVAFLNHYNFGDGAPATLNLVMLDLYVRDEAIVGWARGKTQEIANTILKYAKENCSGQNWSGSGGVDRFNEFTAPSGTELGLALGGHQVFNLGGGWQVKSDDCCKTFKWSLGVPMGGRDTFKIDLDFNRGPGTSPEEATVGIFVSLPGHKPFQVNWSWVFRATGTNSTIDSLSVSH